MPYVGRTALWKPNRVACSATSLWKCASSGLGWVLKCTPDDVSGQWCLGTSRMNTGNCCAGFIPVLSCSSCTEIIPLYWSQSSSSSCLKQCLIEAMDRLGCDDVRSRSIELQCSTGRSRDWVTVAACCCSWTARGVGSGTLSVFRHFVPAIDCTTEGVV